MFQFKSSLKTCFWHLLTDSVGCALLVDGDQVITGANVENALYGAAICAERTAITRMVMEGHRKIQAIAISSDQAEPISPCGICRQVIREFGATVPVYMYSNDGEKVLCLTLDELLPHSFGPENLGVWFERIGLPMRGWDIYRDAEYITWWRDGRNFEAWVWWWKIHINDRSMRGCKEKSGCKNMSGCKDMSLLITIQARGETSM